MAQTPCSGSTASPRSPSGYFHKNRFIPNGETNARIDEVRAALRYAGYDLFIDDGEPVIRLGRNPFADQTHPAF